MKTVYEETECLRSVCDAAIDAAQSMALSNEQNAVKNTQDWLTAYERLKDALAKRKQLIADLLELCETYVPGVVLPESPAILMARDLVEFTYVV